MRLFIYRVIRHISFRLRAAVLSLLFRKIGNRVKIGPGFQSSCPQYISIGSHVYIDSSCNIMAIDSWGGKTYKPSLTIGDGTTIGRFAHITCANTLYIGKQVMIAERVFISDHQHEFQDILRPILMQPLRSKGQTTIEDGCWLGVGCVILDGVTIGRHAVIGANSVVTSNVPSYAVACGCPARVIKQYDPQKKQWKKRKS